MPKMPARAAEVAARPPPERISLPTPRVALVIGTAGVVAILLYLARDAQLDRKIALWQLSRCRHVTKMVVIIRFRRKRMIQYPPRIR